MSFKMFCQTKKTTTIQWLQRSQTKIYFLCLSCIITFWCWWTWTVKLLYGRPTNMSGEYVWDIQMLAGQARITVPIHSYCKSEGTVCVFFLIFFLFASHLLFKRCNQALISPCYFDSFFLALSSTSTGNWTVMLLELLHTHLEDVNFSWKTLNEQMNDSFSGAESEYHLLASCGSWRHCLLVELMQ